MMEAERTVIVIGGGAAGMMAAAAARECGCDVVLLEKNLQCGRKICLTGKGRCNLTNSREWPEFSLHIHPNASFFKSAFYSFDNKETVRWFESNGLPVVEERGMRMFPVSMRASDVAWTMASALNRAGVDVRTGCEVTSVVKEDGLFKCSFFHSSPGGRFNLETLRAKALVIATGGLSYPVTGSSGDGYKFAGGFSHEVADTFPSLTALLPEKYDEMLHGIELVNVALHLIVDKDLVQSEQGDLSFTSGGIEGALGFRLSRKAVRALLNGQKVEVRLDLKPALDEVQLKARVVRDLNSLGMGGEVHPGPQRMKRLLHGLMPARLVVPFMKANNDLTTNNIPSRLKDWRFKIISYVGWERAVVTAGGVSLKEIIPKTMASRLVHGLFFAGEVIDLDGDTGGYNLQIAFSTGHLAGKSAAQMILKEASDEPSKA